jgi:hypothetical protein
VSVMAVPPELVSQYQVSPAGTVPERVSVTPASAHCGELLVGLPGLDGRAFTVTRAVAERLALLHPEPVLASA